MRGFTAFAFAVLSLLSLTMTGVPSLVPGERLWLVGVSLGFMFWAGAMLGSLATRGARDGS